MGDEVDLNLWWRLVYFELDTMKSWQVLCLLFLFMKVFVGEASAFGFCVGEGCENVVVELDIVNSKWKGGGEKVIKRRWGGGREEEVRRKWSGKSGGGGSVAGIK